MSGLDALLERARLIVCVGPGGVGKTTLAAALAIEAAARERRTAVLTIDPARRLAQALGLDGLDDRLRRVPGAGPLDAAMLDTKASYDALVDRIARDPEARARIHANRVYRSFSRTLARSHAYVAMERLHHVLASGEHDLVVLDTPPTRSALDILDAPGRLSRFLDERVLRLFVGGPGAGAWLRAKGGALALRLFARIAGEGIVGELASFFDAFLHLRHGFAERAAEVQAALRDEATAFVLVTAPEATHLADAAYLRDGLVERGAPLVAMLFNRAFTRGADGRPLREASYDPDALLDAMGLAPGPQREDLLSVIAAARALRAEHVLENEARDAALRRFCADAGASAPLRLRFPRLDAEPHTLGALRALLAAAVPVESRQVEA
ncbi:MAG TPA: ArsA-related P-loop ATPase [Sandaracinaceae bacterium]